MSNWSQEGEGGLNHQPATHLTPLLELHKKIGNGVRYFDFQAELIPMILTFYDDISITS